MPIPQLKVRSISASSTRPGQPAEDRRHVDRGKVDLRGEIVGEDARDVLHQPAAGDVRQRLHAAGLADRGEAGADIDARRRQQRRAERLSPASKGAGSPRRSPAISTTRRTSEKPLEWTP